MVKELNTLSSKKWIANYSGVVPIVDITDGILVGDLTIDNSTTPNAIWRCLDNTDTAPIWEKISQSSSWKSETFAASYTPDFLIHVNQEMILTGAITINNPLNVLNGVKYSLRFTMDPIGGYVITLGSKIVLIDGNNNYPSGPNDSFRFEGLGRSDGSIEGIWKPVV